MKRSGFLITTLTILIALAAINFLISRHPIRADLTQKKIYTLSKATKNILKNLDDVVTIRLYFTNDLPPALIPLKRDVDDIIAEFKTAAGNKLQIESIDPAQSAMEEQKVALMGIPPIQLNVVEKDKQAVAKIYLGMTVMFAGKQQTIPVVQRIDNLEYDLAEAIIKVSSEELPKVAWWVAGHAEETPDVFTLIKGAISRRYEVTELKPENIADLRPENFKTLVLPSPGKLSDEELFALDRYLVSGGHVLALVDTTEVGQKLVLLPVDTNVIELLTGYGVTVEDSLVVDAQNARATFSGGAISYNMPYPFWPEVRNSQFNKKEPMVAEIQSVILPWTSPLIVAEGKNGALAISSPLASAILDKDAKLDPQSANDALNRGKHEPKTLIALLGGPFESYYSGDKHPLPQGKELISEGSKDAQLFVVGSSRFISDLVLQTFPQNAMLFQNVLDSFSMGDALVGIRSREEHSRPLMEMSDSVRMAVKYTDLFAGPVILLIAGLVILILRRKFRRDVKVKFA